VARRDERVGRNESYFREVNEQIERLEADGEERRFDIVCECADPDCMKLITISGAGYEQVRDDPRRFIVYPEHVDKTVESVASTRADYWIVQKHGEAAATAEQLDPRG
jgi:hypothetical protein